MRRILAGTLLALTVAAAPAAAAKPKTQHFEGDTANGGSVYFSVKGTKLFNMTGSISVTCVPSSGYPRTSVTSWEAPGAFRLGGTRKVTLTKYVSWWGDTDFNYKVTSKQKRKGLWIVDRHVNFSYVEYNPMGNGVVDQTTWICQGDDDFSVKL